MGRILPFELTILDSAQFRVGDALRRVMEVLNDGPETPDRTRLVGGCVRNALLGRSVTDYDLATQLEPNDVIARVVAAGLRAIPTGIDHGTVTVICEGCGFEVTTLRSDVATDGRHATVSFTDDWAIDAARRDFTLNALYADIKGRVYDPLGSGVADARAGIIKFVGDPLARIHEDYLRTLRFFRFHALYGVGEMDQSGVAACTALASKIHTLSCERVTSELMKWLGAADPVPTLRTAVRTGVINHVLPAQVDMVGFERLVRFQNQAETYDVLARLFFILDGYDSRSILRLSKVQTAFITNLERIVLEPNLSEETLRRDIYRYGYDCVAQRLFLDMAEQKFDPGADAKKFAARIKGLKDWGVPHFPVTGTDLIRQGAIPGPDLGARLKELEEIWIQNGFK